MQEEVMQDTERDNGGYVINFKEIFSLILSKWWTVLLAAIVGALVGFGIAKLTYKESYTLSNTYTIVAESGATDAAYRRLIDAFDSDEFRRVILEKATNVDPTEISESAIKRLQSQMTFSSGKTANIMQIKVTTAEKEKTETIMAIVRDLIEPYFNEELKAKHGLQEYDFLPKSTPMESELVANSNAVKYSLIGGGGLVLVVAVAWAIVSISDTRIKTEEDLTAKYKVPVLGIIPNFEDRDLGKRGYHYYGKRK